MFKSLVLHFNMGTMYILKFNVLENLSLETWDEYFLHWHLSKTESKTSKYTNQLVLAKSIGLDLISQLSCFEGENRTSNHLGCRCQTPGLKDRCPACFPANLPL